jgi:hypothetical protein
MRFYFHLFLLSLAATVLLNVPFLIHYRLPWKDVLGVTAMLAALGPFGAWSYSMRARGAGVSREWQFHFALFPATFALILQAILVAAISYIDFGSVVPTSAERRVMVVAGLAALGLSPWLPSRLGRFIKNTNQEPEPTTMAIPPRAPGSTTRARQGRGSS